MRCYQVLAMVAGLSCTAIADAQPEFPTVEVVQVIKRESTGGCKNPHAEAWETGGIAALTNLHDTSVEKPRNSKPATDDYSDLPDYLSEGH